MYCLQFILQKRLISLSANSYKNLYEALGVSPKATQADIKTAYYKLSMIYHPDRNQGCKEATAKFQEIRNAYDILGDYKSRRLYDRGLLTDNPPDIEEKQSVYKQKEWTVVQKQRPVRTGPSPIYDFDEWSKAHYGQSFQRRTAAKAEFEARKHEKEADENFKKIRVVTFTVIIFFGLFLLMGSIFEDKDKPSKPPKKI